MKLRRFPFLFALAVVFAPIALHADDKPKGGPIKALLITGGCCHDYLHQKDVLKEGIEKRANVKLDIIYTADTTTAPNLPAVYGNPNYANGYDVVIHDECTSNIADEEVVKGVLKPHREDGIPGVNLHCAMHCYRIGNPGEPAVPGTPHALWFEYLGLQSSRHDAQEPIDVKILDKESPIMKGMEDWTTIKEEHYNNVKIFPTAHPLAHGLQTVQVKQKNPDGTTTVTGTRTDDWVDVWTNVYNGKTRVFSTTLGHNTETVADPRYLDLVTRGLLWATGHLGDDGKPASGYGPTSH
jgi:hypothetical protein